MEQKNEKRKHENAFQIIANVVRAMLHMNRGSVVYGAFGSPDGPNGARDKDDDVKVYVKHGAYDGAFKLAQTGKDIPNNLD